MSKIQGTLAQSRGKSLRRKELSPAELVDLMADAIEADRTTNAYISFDREAALHAAAGGHFRPLGRHPHRREGQHQCPGPADALRLPPVPLCRSL